MKLIKEDLDNLERVQDRKTTQGIVMKDAEQESNKAEDNFKEIAGVPEDIKKKKPFIGAEKQPVPAEVETPKLELDEALFEEPVVNEELDGNDVYDIVEEVLNDALDNIANIIASRIPDYNIEWCADEPAQKTNILQAQYIESVVQDLFLNRNYNESLLTEAGGVKDGVLMSTDEEPLTFWDKIYAELDGTAGDDYDYLRLRELPGSNKKDRYQEIGVDRFGNVIVYADSKDKLQHAINVAKYYGLEYTSNITTGFKDPNKAFYCKIIIPLDKQEQPVSFNTQYYTKLQNNDLVKELLSYYNVQGIKESEGSIDIPTSEYKRILKTQKKGLQEDELDIKSAVL